MVNAVVRQNVEIIYEASHLVHSNVMLGAKFGEICLKINSFALLYCFLNSIAVVRWSMHLKKKYKNV